MAKFTVRVELHDAESSDYDVLHKEMELRHFTRTVRIQGVEYYLPDAEYFYESELTKKAVYQEAKDAVDRTGRHAGIVVTRSDGGRYFGGLRKV